MKKSFENWFWEDIENSFNITKVKELVPMSEWENCSLVNLEAPETKVLEKLRTLLEKHYQDWNEEELKLNFIAPLLTLIDYYENDYEYQPFAERTLKAEIGEWELSGTVDWVLAKGKQKPKKPFFFIQEYKRTKMGDSDPLGQLLIAMLVAQKNNEASFPILGTYIIGKDWYFVLLNDKKYTVSKPYQALAKEDLMGIVAMLFEVKNLAVKYIFIKE